MMEAQETRMQMKRCGDSVCVESRANTPSVAQSLIHIDIQIP